MGFGDRLKVWIDNNIGTQTLAADKLGYSPSRINNYIAESSFPNQEVLWRLNALGCNINWLLSGDGEQWAENVSGRMLKDEYFKKHPDEITSNAVDNKLILNWIVDNFGSLEAFCRANSCDLTQWHHYLVNNKSYPPDFAHVLLQSGCDLQYIKEGSLRRYAIKETDMKKENNSKSPSSAETKQGFIELVETSLRKVLNEYALPKNL